MVEKGLLREELEQRKKAEDLLLQQRREMREHMQQMQQMLEKQLEGGSDKASARNTGVAAEKEALQEAVTAQYAEIEQLKLSELERQQDVDQLHFEVVRLQ